MEPRHTTEHNTCVEHTHAMPMPLVCIHRMHVPLLLGTLFIFSFGLIMYSTATQLVQLATLCKITTKTEVGNLEEGKRGRGEGKEMFVQKGKGVTYQRLLEWGWVARRGKRSETPTTEYIFFDLVRAWKGIVMIGTFRGGTGQ